MKTKGRHRVNQDYCKAFGDHLRKLIKDKGYGLREFSAQADMEYGTLSKLVAGTTNTTISTAQHLAEALGVSHSELFDFKFPSKSKR